MHVELPRNIVRLQVVRSTAIWPGKFQFSAAPPPLNGFRQNLEYITMSSVWPHMQIHVALQQRGWSGRTR